MAEPLRKDSAFQASSQPTRQFNVHRYGNPNRGSRRWWFWILLAVVVVWFVVWGRGGAHKTQPASTPVATPPPATTPASSRSISVANLLNDQAKYLGQQVRLRDVLVQSVNGAQSIFVGPSHDQQVLVILKKGAVPDNLQGKPREIPKSGVVTITGIAQKAGSVGELERTAKISRKEAEQVAKDGIVIEADRAEPQAM